MNRIRMTLICLSICAGLGAASAFAGGERLDLPQASVRDQVPERLYADARAALPGLEPSREALRFAWALEERTALDLVPQPFVQFSREYWQDLTAAELATGVALDLSAPAALLRLSPRRDGRAVKPLTAADIELRRHGERLANGLAIEAVADAPQLRAAGASFPDGTLAFRLNPSIGSQGLELAIPAAGNDYLLHVFEPNSPLLLRLSTDRDTVVHGAEFHVYARLETSDGRPVPTDAMAGLLSSPDGSLVTLDFRPGADGGFVARVRHDATLGRGPGLWEVHATATGSLERAAVRRDARSAIASSLPTARLSGAIQQAQARDGAVELSFGVEVVAEGRYELRGVLFGTAADGQLKPFAVAHSADWLRAGQNELVLAFGPELFAAARDLGAPFVLRDLRLMNQGTLELIERREHGPVLALGGQSARPGAR